MYALTGRAREAANTGKEGMRASALAEDRLLDSIVSAKRAQGIHPHRGLWGSRLYLGPNVNPTFYGLRKRCWCCHLSIHVDVTRHMIYFDSQDL